MQLVNAKEKRKKHDPYSTVDVALNRMNEASDVSSNSCGSAIKRIFFAEN